MYEVVRFVLTPLSAAVFRARSIDTDKVPADGPAIIAPNHFSFLDHFFVAVFLRRKVHFMAKSQLFQRPMQFVYRHGGVFPVRRGQRDEEAFKTAHADPGAGRHRGHVLRGRPLADGRAGRGQARASAAWRWSPARRSCPTPSPAPSARATGSGCQFPKVTVQFGDPVRFEQVDEPTKEQSMAAANAVFDRVKGLYGPLRSDGRRNAIRAARAARRATRSRRRRPVAPG